MNMKRILPSVAVLALAAAASAAETSANAKKVLVFSRCEGFNHGVQGDDGGGGEERCVRRRLLGRLRRARDRQPRQVRCARPEQHDAHEDEGPSCRRAFDLFLRALGRRSLRDPRGGRQLLRRAGLRRPRRRAVRRPPVGIGRNVGVQGGGQGESAHRAVQGLRRRHVQTRRGNLPAGLAVLRPREAARARLARPFRSRHRRRKGDEARGQGFRRLVDSPLRQRARVLHFVRARPPRLGRGRYPRAHLRGPRLRDGDAQGG